MNNRPPTPYVPEKIYRISYWISYIDENGNNITEHKDETIDDIRNFLIYKKYSKSQTFLCNVCVDELEKG